MGLLSVVLLLVTGVCFAGIAIFIGNTLSQKKYSPEKFEAYECGIQTHGDTWIQFNVGYYLFSLVFLIFDVEVVFMYPWAVVCKEVGWSAFVEVFLFIIFLFMGLLYAFKKKALVWN